MQTIKQYNIYYTMPNAAHTFCLSEVPQHWDRGVEGVQRSATCSGWRALCLLDLYNSNLRHRWPRVTITTHWASVWTAWYSSAVVPILLIWQVSPGCVGRLHVVYCLHFVLCSTRISAGSTAVYFVLRRPRGHSQGELCNNTHLQTTPSCICTVHVVAMTWRPPSLDFSSASTGYRLIGWNLTWTRLSCFGLVQGAPSLWRMTAFHPCSSERPSSHLINMFKCLGWCFRLTSAPRSMCPTSALPASTICVDYGTYGAHWPRSLPRRSCTPSWRSALTTVTLSSLGLQRSSPTSCQGRSPRGICLGSRRPRGSFFLAGSASPRPHTVLPRSCLGLDLTASVSALPHSFCLGLNWLGLKGSALPRLGSNQST